MSGNIRGARTIAQKVANQIGETVFINDSATNDIVDCIESDLILDAVSDSVENIDDVSKSVYDDVLRQLKQTISLILTIDPTPTRFISFYYYSNTHSICVWVQNPLDFFVLDCFQFYFYFDVEFDAFIKKLTDLKNDMDAERNNSSST